MKEVHKLDRLAAEHARLKQEDMEQDHLQDIMLEHQQTIPEEDIFMDVCDHTPDMLLPTETIELPDHTQVIYQCQACGEELEDVRPLDESDMA